MQAAVRLSLLVGYSSAQTGGFSWTDSGGDSACARMETEQSNIWQADHGIGWRFDLHVQFPLAETDPEDLFDKTIRIEWEHDLTIESLEPQGAITAVSGGKNFVVVQASPQYMGHPTFQVQGLRRGGTPEDLLTPTITCSGGVNVPPPSPPGPAECDLNPQVHAYPIGSTLAAGNRVTMKLASWKPWRVFTLTYFEQASLLIKFPEGITIMEQPHHIGAELIRLSFALNDQPSGGEACGGHAACLEFEAHPSVIHHPHVVCMPRAPPGPPSPPPAPEPKPPPPPFVIRSPPPPAAVYATSTCPLGGNAVATNSAVATDPTKKRVAVHVSLSQWVQDAVVTISVNGGGLEVPEHGYFYAEPLPDAGPSLRADFAFSFKLGAQPREGPDFAFYLEGWRFDRLVAMACTMPVVQQTPVPQYTYDSGVYDDSASYGLYGADEPTPLPTATQPTSPTDGNESSGSSGGGEVGALFGVGALLGVVGLIALWKKRTGRAMVGATVQDMITETKRHLTPNQAGARTRSGERAVLSAEDANIDDGRSFEQMNPAAAAAAAAFAEDPDEPDPRRRSDSMRPAC